MSCGKRSHRLRQPILRLTTCQKKIVDDDQHIAHTIHTHTHTISDIKTPFQYKRYPFYYNKKWQLLQPKSESWNTHGRQWQVRM